MTNTDPNSCVVIDTSGASPAPSKPQRGIRTAQAIRELNSTIRSSGTCSLKWRVAVIAHPRDAATQPTAAPPTNQSSRFVCSAYSGRYKIVNILCPASTHISSTDPPIAQQNDADLIISLLKLRLSRRA